MIMLVNKPSFRSQESEMFQFANPRPLALKIIETSTIIGYSRGNGSILDGVLTVSNSGM